jgi:hypothetical protein
MRRQGLCLRQEKARGKIPVCVRAAASPAERLREQALGKGQSIMQIAGYEAIAQMIQNARAFKDLAHGVAVMHQDRHSPPRQKAIKKLLQRMHP